MDQAENLRNVVKLQNQNLINTARVITITSGKGGVGKSSTAVNLAVQLTKAGKRVIIFDADFGLANVEVMFKTSPKYNLSDMIYHGKSMKDIITSGPMGIGFISGGSSIMGLNDLSKDQISYLVKSVEKLNELADYIIIDTSAGISGQVMEFVMASPEILLVATPDPSSLTDSYSLLKALYRNESFSEDNTKVYVLVNKVESAEDGQAVFDKLNSVVTQFLHGNLDYIGMIPRDSVIENSVRQQKTVSIMYPNAVSAKAFQVLAENLMEGTHKSVQMKKGISQIFSYFLTKRGKEKES